ncbi:MAG: serine/threonine protein kinase [Polyangiaceae bacterium]|nr:serine/threonine protein kinase [Polyangiaceae bacterium]
MTSQLRALGWPDDDDSPTDGDGLGHHQPIGGRYDLVEPIGEGGTSTVWRARDLRTRSDVALKLMSRSSSDEARLLERFRRELELTTRLAGPSYVQILDSGVVGARAFIVMELLEGESLHRRLRRVHTLPGRDLLELCAGLHEALAQAHAVEIVHRDIKPANIFYERIKTPTGRRDSLKLLDLGIAKALWSDARLTTTNTFIGSPHYMSPEQLESGHSVDASADLWSTAVVLYRALTGVLPFEGTGLAVAKRITMSSFLAPSLVSRGELRSFDGFFARAFTPNLADRFRTVDELCADFVAAVLASPLLGSPEAKSAGWDPRTTVVGPIGYASYAERASAGAADPRADTPTVITETKKRG